ncbi:MAG: hypothetical protein AMXMBFR33_01940 [Candidatus Xenobia bacterium]
MTRRPGLAIFTLGVLLALIAPELGHDDVASWGYRVAELGLVVLLVVEVRRI